LSGNDTDDDNDTDLNISGWWTVIILTIVGAVYAGPTIANYVTDKKLGNPLEGLFEDRKKKIKKVTDEYEAKNEGNHCEMSEE
jgi:hypothetical protein